MWRAVWRECEKLRACVGHDLRPRARRGETWECSAPGHGLRPNEHMETWARRCSCELAVAAGAVRRPSAARNWFAYIPECICVQGSRWRDLQRNMTWVILRVCGMRSVGWQKRAKVVKQKRVHGFIVGGVGVNGLERSPEESPEGIKWRGSERRARGVRKCMKVGVREGPKMQTSCAYERGKCCPSVPSLS